jgi:hypothetical protein
MSDTPRTDEADKFVTKVQKLDGKAYDTEWVYASFAQDLEIELNDLRDVNKQLREEIESDNTELDTAWSKVVELQKWKEEALKVMNQWNEVSDYINLNAEVEDLGRFVPQICLKYLKERDEMKKIEEQRDEAIRLATLFQTLYLRLGKAEDEHYNTLMVQEAAKSLAELKGLKFFEKEA